MLCAVVGREAPDADEAVEEPGRSGGMGAPGGSSACCASPARACRRCICCASTYASISAALQSRCSSGSVTPGGVPEVWGVDD